MGSAITSVGCKGDSGERKRDMQIQSYEGGRRRCPSINVPMRMVSGYTMLPHAMLLSQDLHYGQNFNSHPSHSRSPARVLYISSQPDPPLDYHQIRDRHSLSTFISTLLISRSGLGSSTYLRHQPSSTPQAKRPMHAVPQILLMPTRS